MTEPALISNDLLLGNLDQLLTLPGNAGQIEELALVAARVAALMRGHGLQVDTITTAGAPVVIGRRSGRQPYTLMLYHHYDAAPPGPWRAWHHEPYQLAEREGLLYGRGIADGKGPLAAHLSALAALIAAEGELPCNVVLVAEGEALLGSPHLASVITQHQTILKADACLSTGGERDGAGRPFCYTGVKGLLQTHLRTNGANQALPPGLAASVPNPLWRLLWALGHIKSEEEEVLITGFYDDVEGPSRTENQALRKVPFDEAGRLAAWGLTQFLFGMDGSALVRTETTLPTCNVTNLTVEPAGEIAVIPVGATARVDFQLVPNQRPQPILELLRTHLHSKGMSDVVIERLPGGYPAVHTPFEHPFIAQIGAAGERVFGSPLLMLPQGPFTQPLYFFTKAFGLPVAAVGCARPDSAPSAPNEHIALDDLISHGQLLIELLHACARNLAPAQQQAGE